MTEREKIIKVIDEWANKAVKANEFDGASVYNPHNAAELADTLIAAGIGDVKEAEHRAEVAEQKATAWKDCANKWQKYYKEQAAREIEEERK